MKIKLKKLAFSMVCIFIMSILLSSCSDKHGLGELDELATTDKHTQVFTEKNEEGTTSALSAPVNPGTQTVQNNEWTKNYTLNYVYSSDGVTSSVTEKRCSGIYSAVDDESGTVSFFSQNKDDIDQYVLNPSQKSGTHSVVKNSSLDSITTGFMKIAYIDPSFASMSNVEFQNDDTVAGRGAKKYTQSAYSTTGLLTAYAFVWIDNEYGFVSKCQVYSLSGNVNTSWELKSFSVGNVTAESIGFSTDGYDIAEQEASDN